MAGTLRLQSRKNLFDKHTALEIIERASFLTPGSKPTWGTMTVNEMLHHCNILNKMNLEGKRDKRPTTVKQRLLKIVVLYVTPAFPRNIKSPAPTDEFMLLPACCFEQEKQKFIETITAFSQRRTSIKVTHPLFGKLNRKEWGVFTWMHMDHHLRQFGV